MIFCIQHSCVASPHCESGGLVFNVSCPDVMAYFLFTKKNFCHTKCIATQPLCEQHSRVGRVLSPSQFVFHTCCNKITTHFSEVSAILILLIRLSVMNWLFCNGVYLVPKEMKMPHKMGPKIVLMLLIFWVCLHLSGFSPEWLHGLPVHCSVRLVIVEYFHCLHFDGFIPLWVSRWYLSACFVFIQ